MKSDRHSTICNICGNEVIAMRRFRIPKGRNFKEWEKNIFEYLALGVGVVYLCEHLVKIGVLRNNIIDIRKAKK